MAYYSDEEEKQQDPNAPQQAPGSPGAAGLVGEGSPGTAATSAAPGATPSSPGNFVGIQQYLDANKSQSAKLGGQIAGKLGDVANQTQSQINDAPTQFQGIVDQSKLQGLDTAAQDASQITSKAATGAPGSLSDADKRRFGQVATAQYGGPKSVEGTDVYAKAQQAAAQAKQKADLLKTEGGQGQLIKDTFKPTNYSSGENLFDQILFGANAQNKKNAQAAAQPIYGFDNLLSQVAGQGNQYAKTVADQTDQARTGAQSALTQAQSARTGAVDQRLSTAKQSVGDLVDTITKKLSRKSGPITLTPDEMQLLGVDEGQNLYNVNAQNYLKNTFDPNKFITQNEQAQLSALDQLAGTYGGELKNKYTQPGLAGTDILGYTDPKTGLKGALTSAAKEYESVMNSPPADYNKKHDSSFTSWNEAISAFVNRDPRVHVPGTEKDSIELFKDLNKIRAKYGQGPINAKDLVVNAKYGEAPGRIATQSGAIVKRPDWWGGPMRTLSPMGR